MFQSLPVDYQALAMEMEGEGGQQSFDGLDQLGEEHDVGVFIENLEQLRLKYHKEGSYEEAENVKIRILQLREDLENRRRKELRDQQLAERLGVEEAHMKELQEFNEVWDRKVAEFEAHAASLQSQLDARHKNDLAAYMEKIRVETEPRAPRWSRDLLNLRKIQDTQAKIKKYSEAAKTKAQADQMEAKEQAMWKTKRDGKIQALEEQFKHKQDLEMGGLVKRIQSGREEQRQCRKSELERLLQRYHNVKTQLESHQKITREKRERFSGQNQLTATMSMTSSRPGSRAGYARPGSAGMSKA